MTTGVNAADVGAGEPPAGSARARQRAAALLASARRIAVLTGAGISTDSGIPDFRGPDGLWTKNPAAAELYDLRAYLDDPDVRRRVWQHRREHPVWQAEPSAGHLAIVELEKTGKLIAIITQNIDGLHQRAGSDPDLIFEVHGNMFGVHCLGCGDRTTMRSALDRVAAGEPDPACRHCGGILKSTIIAFGENLDPDVLDGAFAAARECDLLLTVGTSLQVYPVAGVVDVARTAGARVVIINGSPTAYDEVADVVVREPIGTVLPALVAAVPAHQGGHQPQ